MTYLVKKDRLSADPKKPVSEETKKKRCKAARAWGREDSAPPPDQCRTGANITSILAIT